MTDHIHEPDARKLADEIQEAQLSGTMSTLRRLRTEVFKAMRDRHFIYTADPRDLSIIRRFYRDPYTIAPRQVGTGSLRHPINSKEIKANPESKSLNRNPPRTPPSGDEAGAPNFSHRRTQGLAEKSSGNKKQIERTDLLKQQVKDDKRSMPTPADIARLRSNAVRNSGRRESKSSFRDRNPEPAEKADIETVRRRYTSFVEIDMRRGNEIRRRVNDWLKTKDVEIRFGANDFFRNDERKVVAESISTTSENTRYDELSLIEKTSGIFSTTITMAASHDRCWILFSVDSAEGNYVAVPRVMKPVCRKGSVDGAPEGWHSGVINIEMGDAEQLIEYILSSTRRLPVFLVGTDSESSLQSEFRERSERWSRFTIGTACFVVASPEVTEYLSTKLGRPFEPRPWTIRTYLPNVDLSDHSDSLRHRFTGKLRIEEEDDSRLSRRFGLIASEARLARKLPDVIADARRAIDVAKNRALLQGSSDRDSLIRRSSAINLSNVEELSLPADKLPSSDVRLVVLLRELIGVASFNEELVLDIAGAYESSKDVKLSARLDDLSAEVQERGEEIELLQMEIEELSAALDKSDDEFARVQSQCVFLRKRLSEYDDPLSYSYHEEESYLDTVKDFSELEGVLSDLQEDGVFFTGDVSAMLDIDAWDSKGRAIRNAVACLRTLIDYLDAVKSGSHSGGMHAYLNNPPTGYFSVSLAMHAGKESDSTMNQFGDLRVFPVPSNVNSNGAVEMQAHFKLAKIGMKSPRLHYYDDSSRSGCIYIGYIGAHLQTVGTN